MNRDRPSLHRDHFEALANNGDRGILAIMTLREVQTEAGALSVEERQQLAAFLTALRMKETGEWEQVTRSTSADHDGWVSLDEAKRRLLGEN